MKVKISFTACKVAVRPPVDDDDIRVTGKYDGELGVVCAE